MHASCMNLVIALKDYYDDALYRGELDEQSHCREVANLSELTIEELDKKLRQKRKDVHAEPRLA